MASFFNKSRLENGATLLTERVPQFQSLSIGVWVNAGTRHEISGQAGVSHFLEHMMFKGTKKRSALDIAQAVDRVGGEFNAFTSKEYTCFHLLLLARDIKLAVDMMSDILMNSTFKQEEIEHERKVILQEIAMVEDNPEELIHDLFFEQAFGNHPLGRPILGNLKTIATFNRSTILSYFRKHYAPSQLIISVAGDISHTEIKRQLNRSLKMNRYQFQKGQDSMGTLSQETPKITFGIKQWKRKLEQTHLLIGFPGLPYDHPDRFAAFLLNAYLGGGMSSSLFQEIREKRGLAYTIYSSLASFSDTGLFSVYVGTHPREVGCCLEVCAQEVSKLCSKKLEKKALDILKDHLKGALLLNSDFVENRMTTNAKNEMFFGKYYSIQDICRRIDRVNAQDILRLSHMFFKPKNLILSLMGPTQIQLGRFRKKMIQKLGETH